VFVSVVVMSVVALAAGPAQAQPRINVLAGVNFSTFSFDPPISEAFVDDFEVDRAESSGRKGVAVGVAYTAPLTGKANFQIEGLFSQIGFGFAAEIDETLLASTAGLRSFGLPSGTVRFESDTKINAFETVGLVSVPVGATGRACVQAGVFAAFKMSQSETAREIFNGDVEEFEVDEEDQTPIKGSTVGIALGAEVHATPMISVGARLNLGLNNVDDSDPDDTPFNSVKVRVLRIYVAFKIK
jgi:hypothetical protein